MASESGDPGWATVDRPAGHADFDQIIDWIVGRIAELLEVPDDSVEIEVPFIELGLSSVQAIEISNDLERWLGIELPPTLAYDYPTIEAAAGYISGQLDRD